MRTNTVKKKFSHIDGVSGFSDWERAVRLINYMRGTFIEPATVVVTIFNLLNKLKIVVVTIFNLLNKLKIVTTTVAEIRETEKLIFYKE